MKDYLPPFVSSLERFHAFQDYNLCVHRDEVNNCKLNLHQIYTVNSECRQYHGLRCCYFEIPKQVIQLSLF